jgi:hypothetical protein
VNVAVIGKGNVGGGCSGRLPRLRNSAIPTIGPWPDRAPGPASRAVIALVRKFLGIIYHTLKTTGSSRASRISPMKQAEA